MAGAVLSKSTTSTLLRNGRFYTDAHDRSPASALLIRGGEIIWLGDNDDAPGAERVLDLQGACVLPGLTDAHIHVFAMALSRLQIDLAGGKVGSVEAVLDLLRKANAQNDSAEWLQGCDLNEARLAEGRMPNRRELDEAVGDRPVLLRRYCGHVAVFNTAAMRLLGLSDNQADPRYGHFERFDDGSLNGLAYERAAESIFRAAPAPAAHLIRQGIRDAVADCTRLGLTSLVEAAVGFSIGYDRESEIWETLQNDDDLPVRFGFMAYLDARAAAARGLVPSFDRRWSRETLKFFADGIVGGRTSALSEPFCDRGGTGTFMLSESEIEESILEAHAAGWRVAVHATGDRAVELVARAYERAQANLPEDRRHRIEHCFCPSPGVFPRMRDIKAMVVMQPSFLWRMGDSIRAGLGSRTDYAYPVRSVTDADALLALSSDAPTGLFSPWDGVRSAMDRLSSGGQVLGPKEAVSAREAIDGYIAGGALAMRHETFRGKLMPGFAADLTVLDRDPFDLSAEEVSKTRSVLTMTEGRIVHQDL